MAEIYVPIDYSNVRETIPPGQDIIYSTMCIVRRKVIRTHSTYNSKWKSHVLITPKGIAYTKPVRKAPPELKYIPLSSIHKLFKRGFNVVPKRRDITIFGLAREPNYETKEQFKIRKNKFKETILPYYGKARFN